MKTFLCTEESALLHNKRNCFPSYPDLPGSLLNSPGRGGREGTPHMKVVGMLVVSLRGVNFGFWSHLGCSGQNAIIFSHEGLVQGCTPKTIKISILSVF